LCVEGDRGESGLPGPPSPVLPAELLENGEIGDPGANGLPGFPGPRGTKSGQTIQLGLVSFVYNSKYMLFSGIDMFMYLSFIIPQLN